MDTFNLERFVAAQDMQDNPYTGMAGYPTALAEVKSGRKWRHWIWYVFPQLAELGYSSTAKFYGISGIEEAKAYFAHPVLGARLLEISNALLELDTDDPFRVFGHPDHMKVRSCMTLFDQAVPEETVFQQVLQKFYHGEPDYRTIDKL